MWNKLCWRSRICAHCLCLAGSFLDLRRRNKMVCIPFEWTGRRTEKQLLVSHSHTQCTCTLRKKEEGQGSFNVAMAHFVIWWWRFIDDVKSVLCSARILILMLKFSYIKKKSAFYCTTKFSINKILKFSDMYQLCPKCFSCSLGKIKTATKEYWVVKCMWFIKSNHVVLDEFDEKSSVTWQNLQVLRQCW